MVAVVTAATFLAAPSGSSAAPASSKRGAKMAKPSVRQARTAVNPRRSTSVRDLHRRQLRPTHLGPRQRMFDDIRRIWSGRYLRRGTTAVYVVDAKTGEELYAVHEDVGLNPASNVKLVATATALDVLGPNWRHQTSVYGPTPHGNGLVKGNIYLYGDHDGSLDADHVIELAEAVAARGIRRIDGDVLIGTSTRDAIGWPWLTVTVEGGATPAEAPTVTVHPKTDFVKVVVKARTSWSYKAWAHLQRPKVVRDAQGREHVELTLAGFIRARRKQTLRKWIPRRAMYTASVLHSALTAAGITVTGKVRQEPFGDYVRAAVVDHDFLPVELAVHRSAPVAQLMKTINKQSDNILADQLTRAIGRKRFGGDAALDKGAQALAEWLGDHADVSRCPVVLDTGSGLSYQTRLSARQIVRTLRVAGGYSGNTPTKHASIFRESLAVAGIDGTLRRRFRGTNVSGRLRGKTGTLSSVIALSGYLHGPKDRVLAFAIVTNDTLRHLRWAVRNEHEAMLLSLHRYLAATAKTKAATSATKP